MILRDYIHWLKRVTYDEDFWEKEINILLYTVQDKIENDIDRIQTTFNSRWIESKARDLTREPFGPPAIFSDFNYEIVNDWYITFGNNVLKLIECYRSGGTSDLVRLRVLLGEFYYTLKIWNVFGQLEKVIEVVSLDISYLDKRLRELKNINGDRFSFEVQSYLQLLSTLLAHVEKRIEEDIERIDVSYKSAASYQSNETIKNDLLKVSRSLEHLTNIGYGSDIVTEIKRNSNYSDLKKKILKRNAGIDKTREPEELVPYLLECFKKKSGMIGDSKKTFIRDDNEIKRHPISEFLINEYKPGHEKYIGYSNPVSLERIIRKVLDNWRDYYNDNDISIIKDDSGKQTKYFLKVH